MDKTLTIKIIKKLSVLFQINKGYKWLLAITKTKLAQVMLNSLMEQVEDHIKIWYSKQAACL